MSKNIRRAPRGFTLIELVVVVAVIAILAALLVPTILGQAERARVTRARSDVNEIGKAAARMRADTDASKAACYTIANLRSPAPPGSGEAGEASTDCLPGSLSSIPHCVGQGSAPGELCWGGPYLPRSSGAAADYRDPWNNTYRLIYDEDEALKGRQGNIVVWSYGLNKAQEKNEATFDCSDLENDDTRDDICAVF